MFHREDDDFFISDNVHMLSRDEMPNNGRTDKEQSLWLMQREIVKNEFPEIWKNFSYFKPSHSLCGNNQREIRDSLKAIEKRRIAVSQEVEQRQAEQSKNRVEAEKLRKAGKPIPKHLR